MRINTGPHNVAVHRFAAKTMRYINQSDPPSPASRFTSTAEVRGNNGQTGTPCFDKAMHMQGTQTSASWGI